MKRDEPTASGGVPDNEIAPPVILDRLLAEMDVDPAASGSAEPVEGASRDAVHRAAGSSSVEPPPLEGVPPPRLGPKRTGTPASPTPDGAVIHGDPVPPQTTTPNSATTEIEPQAGWWNDRRLYLYLLLGCVNVLLLALVVLFYQDRTRLQERLTPVMTETAPSAVTPQVTDPAATIAAAAPVPVERPVPGVPTASLAIPKLVLSRSVNGFGQYEPIPDIPLTARHVPYIQAYIEMANPHPEVRDDDRFIYYMTQHTRLYRTDIGPSEPLLDTSVSLVIGGLSPRSDFHSVTTLTPTRRVQPGEHTLEIQITDQVSGQQASRRTTFTVHPPSGR